MKRAITLRYDANAERQPVTLPGSKSLAARALILQYIYGHIEGREISITGIPDCDDTHELALALQKLEDTDGGKVFSRYDLGMGGTSLRFFLALVASLPGFSGELFCAESLRHRPLKPLVKALREAGAIVSGDETPLYVEGMKLRGRGVKVEGNISSQFVSALMMASLLWDTPYVLMPRGLVSAPYVEMTSRIIDKMATCSTFKVEGDWSAAAFFYEFVLLNPCRDVYLRGLTRPETSMQGDSACQEIFNKTGVKSEWIDGDDGEYLLHIRGDESRIKELSESNEPLKFEMKDTPDLVPSLAVGLCLAGIKFEIKGVGHLRHKESNRIETLKAELRKAGFELRSDGDTIYWYGGSEQDSINDSLRFSSHGDHRIAMAFAMTAPLFGSVIIEDADAVTKSFPDFYTSIPSVGIFSV